VQDFTLLVELYEIPVGLSLQHVKVPLDSTIALRYISYSSQFCFVSKLAEGIPCPVVEITNEGI